MATYDDIIARLRGEQQFVNDVKSSLSSGETNKPLFTGAFASTADDDYYKDPFRRQNAIRGEVAAEPLPQTTASMFSPSGGGGDSGGGVTLTPEQIAFLESETLDQRGERLKNDWLGLKPLALAVAAPGLFMKEYGGDFRANFNGGIDNFLGGLFGQTQPTISRNPYDTMRGSETSSETPQPSYPTFSYVVDGSGNVVTDGSGNAIGTGSTNFGGNSYTTSSGDTYSGGGGYGGGGSLESTYGGGL